MILVFIFNYSASMLSLTYTSAICRFMSKVNDYMSELITERSL